MESNYLPTEYKHFGAFLAALRTKQKKVSEGGRARRVSQKDIALEVGLSPATIGFIEVGQRQLPADPKMRAAIATAYGLESNEFERIAALFGESSDDRIKPGPKPQSANSTSAPIETPLEELEAAYQYFASHMGLIYNHQQQEPSFSLEFKTLMVKICQESSGKKILSESAMQALSPLIPVMTNEGRYRQNSAASGKMQTIHMDAALLLELDGLVTEHKNTDTVLKSTMITAWLRSIRYMMEIRLARTTTD